ncbi:MAG: hypothetical protein QOI88_1906 [Gammaproteobacteria bacterium]|jgi:hypothetical protein|nr:hypothetical protein [Gammaproteobacteria bacterium]
MVKKSAISGSREMSSVQCTADAATVDAAANHRLGMLNVQARQPAAGLPFLHAALTAHPEIPDYWLGYLEALLQLGKPDSAHQALALGRQYGLSGAAVEEFAARLAAGVATTPATNIDLPVSPGARPFVVLAPAYNHRSAGIRVMHTLCNELNRCGRTAHLIFYRFKPGGVDFYTPEGTSEFCGQHQHIPRLPASSDITRFRALIDEGIVVYPEVLQANPLNAPRVVRYVLNHPELNGYPMLEGERDFIVSFNRQYRQNPHSIASLFIDEPLFHDENTRPALERTLDCTYIGKGAGFGQCFRIPGSVSIERASPSDKESLAILLRNTRYFFTWDVNTQTNADALLCGAIIVVPRWAPFSSACFETDFGPLPYADSSVENGIIKIAHVGADYEVKRRNFIDSIKALARGRTQAVERLAREIEDYFAIHKMSA